MPTKYDVFAKIIEKAPCKISSLDFKVPVYNHIKNLLEENLILKRDNLLLPLKNNESEILFKIIKWSLKNNLDYNVFLRQNMIKVIQQINSSKNITNNLSNNPKNLEIINFLSKNQFLVLYNKRPKQGSLISHSILKLIIKLNSKNIEIKERFLSYEKISQYLLKTKKQLFNPFQKNIFEFLAGSAQLEGSTVTIGETIDLVLRDIYPNKPAEDIQMIKNLNESLNYIINHLDEDISSIHIKEINKLSLFTLHKGAGFFKKTKNKILGNPKFQTSAPEKVPEKIELFCREFNSINSREEAIKKLGFIHNEFQRIHPFPDGNSRTTRMILNWLIMKFNLPLLVLKKGSFERYMELTKLSKKRDDSELRDFLLNVMYHEYLTNN